MEGLFQTKFLASVSGAWSCVFNDRSLAERLSSGHLAAVKAEELESTILARKKTA